MTLRTVCDGSQVPLAKFSPTPRLDVFVLVQGLAKLQKTQKDVDVLVEEAKIKAVEVEKKVAGADAFAEQVRLHQLQTYVSETNTKPFAVSH